MGLEDEMSDQSHFSAPKSRDSFIWQTKRDQTLKLNTKQFALIEILKVNNNNFVFKMQFK